MTREEIDRANEYARRYLEQTGRPLIITPTHWRVFEAAGLDMGNFKRNDPMPRVDDGYDMRAR